MRRKSYTELVNKIIPLRSIESKADIVSRQETPSSPKQSDDEKGNLSKARKQIRRMSTGELELLASSEDDFVFDCILNRVPMVSTIQFTMSDHNSNLELTRPLCTSRYLDQRARVPKG